jgi:hypothetical protein
LPWSDAVERISPNNFREYFPFTSSLYHKLTGLFARRIFLLAFLILIFLTTAVRVRSYLLVRKFQRVLAGLSKLEIDKATEEELVRSVPYLIRGPSETRKNSHVERRYYLVLSDESDWLINVLYFRNLGYWIPHDRALKIADWLGYREINFHAQALVVDGNVSRIRYEIACEYTLPPGSSDFISVRSAHGVWDQEDPTVVTSADDESPQFRVSGDARSLHVTYMFDAPPDQTSLAFKVDLTCFWGLRGCRTAREIAPTVWQYKKEVEERAASRLMSGKPCPDRILAGRVKYLPDLDVLLLDVVKVPDQLSVDEWGRAGKSQIGYGLRQIIQGSMGMSQEAKKFTYNPEVRGSSNLSWKSANPLSRVPQLGDQVLLFTGALFQSCQIVLNTPSALSAVQKAVPNSWHEEDEITNKRM